jgi:hypothetical protein
MKRLILHASKLVSLYIRLLIAAAVAQDEGDAENLYCYYQYNYCTKQRESNSCTCHLILLQRFPEVLLQNTLFIDQRLETLLIWSRNSQPSVHECVKKLTIGLLIIPISVLRCLWRVGDNNTQLHRCSVNSYYGDQW